MQRGREAARVGCVDVETDGGALERKPVAGRISGGFGGADARRSQPREIERQIAEGVIIRRILCIASGKRRVGECTCGANAAQRSRRVGAAQCRTGAASECRRDGVGARDGALRGKPRRCQKTGQRQCETHGRESNQRTLREAYTPSGKSICTRVPPDWDVTAMRAPWKSAIHCAIASPNPAPSAWRSEEHTSELQSRLHLVCRLLLEKKKIHLDDTVIVNLLQT